MSARTRPVAIALAATLAGTLAAGTASAVCPYDPKCPVFDNPRFGTLPGSPYAPTTPYVPGSVYVPGYSYVPRPPVWTDRSVMMNPRAATNPSVARQSPYRADRLPGAYGYDDEVERFPGRETDQDGISPDSTYPGTTIYPGMPKERGAMLSGPATGEAAPRYARQPRRSVNVPQQFADHPQQPANGFYTGPHSGARR